MIDEIGSFGDNVLAILRDFGKLEAARLQPAAQRIVELGSCGDTVLATLRAGRERCSPRLLAELLGAMRPALAEQFAGIGRPGARRRALVHAAASAETS